MHLLTPQMWLVFAIMIGMVVLFLTEKIRSDVVALLVMVVLGITQLIPVHELFSGFASNAVISIIAVMILGTGLERAGLVGTVSKFTLRLSKGNKHSVFVILALITGIVAGFLRSLGSFALFLPVINRISLFLNIPKKHLLLPIGFCAIIGGTITILGSGPLIVLNEIMTGAQGSGVEQFNIKPISMFSVFPIGLSLLIVTIILFSLLGKLLLPKTSGKNQQTGADKSHFKQNYEIDMHFHEFKFSKSSPLIGLTLRDLEKIIGPNLWIIAISHKNEISIPPLKRTRITENTRIALLGSKSEAQSLSLAAHGLKRQPRLNIFSEILNPMRSGISEIVVPPGSDLVGKEIAELHARSQYHIQVLAAHRNNKVRHGQEMRDMKINSGDTLCVYSRWDALTQIEKHHDFAVVTTEYPREQYAPEKKWHAFSCLALALVLVLIFNVSPAVGLMTGALGMILTGVISMDDAYESVSWRTIFLLAGIIPFGLSMQTTGTASWLADEIFVLIGSYPHWVVLTCVAIIASLFSLVMTNVGATVVLVPVAIHLAQSIHADPRLFAVTVALATSNSFLIPTHQVNALVSGPGGYKTTDFLKAGSIVSIIYLLVMLPAVYWFMS